MRVLGLAIALIALIVPGASNSQQTSVLHGWYSPSRSDFHVTTHSSWRGWPGATRSPDYEYIGQQGRVINPLGIDGEEGVVGLNRWWSNNRSDNSALTHPSWQGAPGQTRSPDYEYRALEGYAFDAPLAGTTPLYRWWSDEKSDNATGAGPAFEPDSRELLPQLASGDYASRGVEGWVMPPFGKLSVAPDPADFGYDSTPLQGDLPVVVVLVSYQDIPFSIPESVAAPAFYNQLVFGPQTPNVAEYFQEISGGRFSISNPVGIRQIQHPLTGSDAIDAIGTFDETLIDELDKQIDFSQFDRPGPSGQGDGEIDRNELSLVFILAPNPADPGHPCLGQSRYFGGATDDGVRLDANISVLSNGGEMKIFLEEILHGQGPFIDVYGPGVQLNNQLSIASATGCRTAVGNRRIHLDPWHKMIAGWERPRILPISAAGGVARLDAAQLRGPRLGGPGSVVLFYDPERGRNEFLLAEFRTRQPAIGAGYDANVNEQGVAIWYVRRELNASGILEIARFQFPHRRGVVRANYILAPPIPGDFGWPVIGRAGFFGTGGVFHPGLWTSAQGEFSLRWGDGADIGLRFRVHDLAPRDASAFLAWRHRDGSFLPRLDAVYPARVNANAPIRARLSGVFAPGERISVMAEPASGSSDASVLLADLDTGNGLSALELVTTAQLTPGRWYLYVNRTVGTEDFRSNDVFLQVE